MFDWFKNLSKNERRTFWACFGGWALDAMDIQIYSLVMPTLIVLWGLSKSQAGTLATAVLVVASLGGWIAGILADKIGRVRVLQITIVWFASFTFLSGLTHEYWQLLITRSFQGLGFGGEWAVGAVLISESVSSEVRGRVVGSMHSGWAIGYGLAVGVATICFGVLPQAIAWRVLFLVGLLPAIAVFFIWRYVEEPTLYVENRRATPARASWEIFAGDVIGRTNIATLLAAGIYGGNYVLITWLPTYLKLSLHLSPTVASGYLALNILGSFAGAFLNASLSDWIGRRYTFIICSLCQVCTVAIYIFAAHTALATSLLVFVLGMWQSGTAAGMGAALAELFPTRIRATGQGFSANAGRAIGATSPTLVGILAARTSLGHAMAICSIAAYGIVVIAASIMPETRGIDLREAGIPNSRNDGINSEVE